MIRPRNPRESVSGQPRRVPVSSVVVTAIAGLFGFNAIADAQEPATESATGSLLVAPPAPALGVPLTEPHGLRAVSMFALASPEARLFQEHDLIEIIVRETSRAKSTHELELEKDLKLTGAIAAWPDLRIEDLLDFIVRAGRTTDLPRLDVKFKNNFEGDGEYERRDDFTARLTAEVVEVLPNGNLILESRTWIKTDEEESLLKLTGICRPEDVTPGNSILSNQLHDLKIEKIHTGELKKTNQKGILTKIFETIFAF